MKKWIGDIPSSEVSTIIEKVSGGIPISERRFSEIFEMREVGQVIVKSLDRLGRNGLDIQQTIQKLLDKKINLIITDLGINTLLPNGKVNHAAKVMISLLAALAEMERNLIRERQKEGIEIAKIKGKYKGRARKYSPSPEEYVQRYPKVVAELMAGNSIRRTAKYCDVSKPTVIRVKKSMENLL